MLYIHQTISIKRCLASLLLFAVCFYFSSAGAFNLVRPENTIASHPGLTETYWEGHLSVSGGAAAKDALHADRLGLHRYQSKGHKPVAALLYLPGTHMNGVMSDLDAAHNLPAWLADRGVVLFTLDYRNHFLGNDDLADQSVLKNWTIERYVDDAMLALGQVRQLNPDLPVFVAGFSRGASIAWGVACQDSDLSGIIALDGSFKQYREKPYDREAAVNKLRNSGEYAYILSRSRGWPGRQTLMRSVRQNPNGPALDGSNDTVGHQLSRTLHNAWGAGVLTNVLGGVSDITALATLMENYDRYYPAVQNIDNASIASVADDPSTPVDNGWGEIRMPVLYMGASRMGAEHLLDGIYSAGKSGSGDVTIYVLEDYGHLDVLVAENAQQDVYTPLLRWLLGRLPVRDPGVRPG